MKDKNLAWAIGGIIAGIVLTLVFYRWGSYGPGRMGNYYPGSNFMGGQYQRGGFPMMMQGWTQEYGTDFENDARAWCTLNR